MTDQSVGGVSVPLTIDRSGWTAGLKAARQELAQFKSEAQSAGVGGTAAGRSIRGGAVAAPPLAALPQSQLPAVSNVSPRFAVSQGAIREMRVQMNQQIRQLASQGEAVTIPVKLGRVPYGAIRNEISTGIGEVPVRITLDPSSIAAIRGQITGAIGRTGGGGRVSPGQQELVKRATGGPVSPHQDVVVGDGGRAEVFRPTVPGRIYPQVTMALGGQVAGRYSRSQASRGLTPQQGDFGGNIMAAAGRLQPHHIQGGVDWYRQANLYMKQMAQRYNVPVPRAAGALAALSAGTSWESNKTKFERIMAAHGAGKPFPYGMGLDAHRKALAILEGKLTPEKAFASSPKVGQFYQGIAGDPSALVIDLWATRTATRGGMNQPGRARPGIEAAFMKGAKHTGLQPAEFQAALWLLEKEESKVPPGQMGLGFARGGRVPGQLGMGFASKFPKSRPFCSVCGTTMANPFDHNTSAQHKKNLAKRGAFQGTKLTQRPSWMNSLANYEHQYDEQELEYELKKLGAYPGGKWTPGMAGGGRARMRGAGFVPGLRSIAQGYNRMAGLPPMQEQMLHPLNADFSRRTAAAYEAMPGGTDPLSRRAYGAFAEETEAQYKYLQQAGFKFEPDPGDPYTPKAGGKLTKMQLAARDVSRNKRLLAFSSSLEHPLLTDEQNLMFRHVHDMMGHLTEGYSIGPRGEFNAAVKHSQMFSPLARRAMLAETHGQNSVVNFSPTVLPGYGGRSIADVNKAAPGSIYADQKARGLPDDILDEFYRLTGIKRARGGKARLARDFAGGPINYWDDPGIRKSDWYVPDAKRKWHHNPWLQHMPYTSPRTDDIEGGQGGVFPPSKADTPDVARMREAMGQQITYDRINRRRLMAGGGFIRSLFGRAGPSKDQLRAGYGSRFSGFSEKFGTATTPPAGPAMSALRMLGHTLSAEQRQPDIDLNEAIKRLPNVRRESGATSRFLHQQAQLVQLREAQQMRPLAGSQFEPGQQDLWAAPITKGLESKYIKVKPHWLPELGIDPTKISKNAAGGPVTKTFRLADPNGLHMRPAAAFARAMSQTQASVSGRNLSNGQDLVNPESMYSWMALGARQGHKIELTATGADSGHAMKLFAQLMGFNPEKSGMSYHEFQKKLGVSSPGVEAIETRLGQRQLTTREIDKALRTPARAAGGPGKGAYIVNEIGREKFVPARIEHVIPPEVAEQLPEGGGLAARLARARGEEKPEPWKPAWMRRPSAKDLTGRAQGGVVEIPGHGARLWEAPEDGWIIPARLAGKVPARHTGGPAEAGHTHPHMNRQGTGFQDQYGRPVPNAAALDASKQPVRDTFRGALFGAPQQGPPAPGSSWRGAMFGSGGSNALRDSFTSALQTVFGPNGKATVQVQPTPGVAGLPSGSQGAPGQFKALQAAGFVGAGIATGPIEGGTVAELRARTKQFRDLLPEGGGSGDVDEMAARARRAMASNRGLSGGSGTGGFFAATLGGGGARRQALAEAQSLSREYQRRAPTGTPRGVDAVQAWNDAIGEMEETLLGAQTKLEGFTAAGQGMSDEAGRWRAQIKDTTSAINTAKEAQASASDLRLQAERKFQQASGGALRNIAALTTAGFAFSALSGAITTGITLATKAAQPFVDELTGFQSTATRVTQGLAGQARQLGGNVPSAIAGAAGPAGVGAAGLDFLTRTLGPSVAAKAGAAAAAEASDLFRAAAGAGRAPTGLFSGFGGVGGSPLLAEFLGGGKGFTEVLGGDVGALRGQANGLQGINALRGSTNVGTGRDPIGDFLLGTGNGGSRGLFGDIGAAAAGALGGPTAAEYGPGGPPNANQEMQAQRDALKALTAEVEDYNAAAKRGADALGEHTTGLRLATREELGLTEATDDLKQAQMARIGGLAGDESAGKLADAGIFLVDAAGNLAAGTEQYKKFFQQSAQGRTIGDPTAFAAQQARQLQAQRQVGRIQTERAINLEIPGQVGQQLAANPFTSAFSGIPGLASASKGLVSNLEETQRLQKEITKEGQAAVEAQARDIDVQTGTRQGAQFRSYMADVTSIGNEIAGITEAISNRQAQVSFAAYSNNIRILNRSISDARGLLTGRGGAGNLGAIQRAQFDLSRQSQRLSLQSQALQLQSNQLSLELSQRQINFQKAIAGFQAPGITGQERAARMAEAELEASFAQKQLNIGVQQQGIGQQQLGISGQQFGLELKAFMVSAQRSLGDLEAQRSITVAQFQLEQEQIAAQKRIAALTIRMGQRQASAQALVQEAQGNFNSVLSAAAQQIAQFGGTAAGATKVIMAALRGGAGTAAAAYKAAAGTYGGQNTYSNRTPHATGYSGMASGPTSFIAGEAGPEHVLVLRNPKSGVMGPAGGGGGGSPIVINISGNTFGSNMDPDDVARKLADEVERRLDTKARLLSVSA